MEHSETARQIGNDLGGYSEFAGRRSLRESRSSKAEKRLRDTAPFLLDNSLMCMRTQYQGPSFKTSPMTSARNRSRHDSTDPGIYTISDFYRATVYDAQFWGHGQITTPKRDMLHHYGGMVAPKDRRRGDFERGGS